ncbi:HTH domain-containing protein [Gymnodinialimonas sp. 2305UL16-5]|uniref:helix-turn-helix transcriptional regulator n=1 Tax=Gymnodinialimonas mytili TaxID=3126503 RepID=UPI0030B69DBC
MRASRLLRILLILQNRGRQTARQLAEDLECAPRTILRDVDAMTEAGLPIIVHQGNQGGIELGFNYRTRLTGLTEDEARALAVQLSAPNPAVLALGMDATLQVACTKLIESFPDKTRHVCDRTAQDITVAPPHISPDAYVMALAEAIRERRIVRLRARSATPLDSHPARLSFDSGGWILHDARIGIAPVPQPDWGDLNISSRRYAGSAAMGKGTLISTS